MRPLIELCAKVCEEFDDKPDLHTAMDRRPVDWLKLAAAAIRALPQSEIGAGAREAVICNHEPFEGRCVHCDIRFIDGEPTILRHAALPEGYVRVPKAMLDKMVADQITSGGPGPLYNVGYAAACEYWGNLLLTAAQGERK